MVAAIGDVLIKNEMELNCGVEWSGVVWCAALVFIFGRVRCWWWWWCWWCWWRWRICLLNKWHSAILDHFGAQWCGSSPKCSMFILFTAFNTECVTIVSLMPAILSPKHVRTFPRIPFSSVLCVCVLSPMLVYFSLFDVTYFFSLSFPSMPIYLIVAQQSLLHFGWVTFFSLYRSIRTLFHCRAYAPESNRVRLWWRCYIRLMYKTEFMMTSLL